MVIFCGRTSGEEQGVWTDRLPPTFSCSSAVFYLQNYMQKLFCIILSILKVLGFVVEGKVLLLTSKGFINGFINGFLPYSTSFSGKLFKF